MPIQRTPLIPLVPVSTSGASSFARQYPDFMIQIAALRRHRDRAMAKLEQMSARDRRSAVRSLLASGRMHLLYVYEGTRRANALEGSTPPSIREVVERCNPYQHCDEPATPVWVRRNGRKRLVTRYGPIKRGRQMLVADVLRRIHPPLEQQFLFRGGMPAAFRAVEAAYAEGFSYGVEVDFVDFYGSVGHDGLAELLRPLPSRVVQNVVCGGVRGHDDGEAMATMPPSLSWCDPTLNRQHGISLGSACSPVVGERILGMLVAPADDCRTVAYADNVFVLGRSREAVQAYFRTMQQRVEGFAGGRLRPRMDIEEVRCLANEDFMFLHHVGSVAAEGFVWAPDRRKLDYYLTGEDDRIGLTLSEIDQAETSLAHWRRAYPSWPNGDLFEIEQLASLAARRYYLQGSTENRSRAAHALMLSYYAHGASRELWELAPTGTVPRHDARREELLEAAAGRLRTVRGRGSYTSGAASR